MQSSFIDPCAMLVRYLIISIIHQNKRKIIKKLKSRDSSVDLEESDDKVVNTKLKIVSTVILKILSSHWIVLVFPVIWAILFESIQFGILISQNFHCSGFVYSYKRIVHAIFIGIVFFILALICVFDTLRLIPNIIKCKWKTIFWKSDPYNYRVDMLSLIPILPLFAIWFFTPLLNYIFSLNVEIIVILGFWTTGSQTLFITIIKKIYDSNMKSKMKNRTGDSVDIPMIE